MPSEGVSWGERAAQLFGVWCVALVLLSIWPSWDWIACMLIKDGAPAWVQAVGSVVAIIVAIAIPWRRESLDRQMASSRERDQVAVAAISVSNQLQALDEALVLLTSDRAVAGAVNKRGNLQYWIDALNALPVPSNSDIDAVRFIDLECARSVAYVAAQLLRLRSGLLLAMHSGEREVLVRRYVEIMASTLASSRHAQLILNNELRAHDNRRAAAVK